MGLRSSLKKIGKKISGGLKKVGSLVYVASKIAKKAWTEVKRAWNTKLGRMVIIAAAVWAGGAFLAAQSATAGAGAATAGTTTAAGTTAATGATATAAAAEAGAVGATSGATGAVGAGLGESVAIEGVGSLASSAIPNVATAPGVMGAIGKGAAAVGNFATNHPLLTYGLLQTGGNMLASANTPTQAEEYEDILAATHRANDLSKFRSPYTPSGRPTARFKSSMPVPNSNTGLLEG